MRNTKCRNIFVPPGKPLVFIFWDFYMYVDINFFPVEWQINIFVYQIKGFFNQCFMNASLASGQLALLLLFSVVLYSLLVLVLD